MALMWLISAVAKCWEHVEAFPALQPCVNPVLVKVFIVGGS